MKVVKKVGALKKKNGEKFFIRSSRESDMIKNLIKKAGKDLPKSLVVDVWRKLITAANMYEQPLTIATTNPEYESLIREYYSSDAPVKFFKKSSEVISALKSGKALIGIFALNDSKEWCEKLPENFRVFAQIPFMKKSKIRLVAVAEKVAEKSKDDVTLVLAKSGLKAVDGFHLTHKSGKVLGHYAK